MRQTHSCAFLINLATRRHDDDTNGTQAGLENFLNKVAAHEVLSCNDHFKLFLQQNDEELKEHQVDVPHVEKFQKALNWCVRACGRACVRAYAAAALCCVSMASVESIPRGMIFVLAPSWSVCFERTHAIRLRLRVHMAVAHSY